MAFLDRYESRGVMERIIRKGQPRVWGGGLIGPSVLLVARDQSAVLTLKC